MRRCDSAMLQHLPPTHGGHLDRGRGYGRVLRSHRLSGLAQPIPMPKRLLSTWLRSGLWDRGTLFPTTAGVPQGGIIAPVISHMVLDGLESVVHGGHWHRRVHQINDVRLADDFLVTV